MYSKFLLFLFSCLVAAQVHAQNQLTQLQITDTDLNSLPSGFHEHKGKLYFAASSSYFGEELWVSDGTEANTKLYKDLNTGPESSNPKSLLTLKDELFFIATDGTGGHQVFKVNPSNNEVQRLTSFTDKYIKTLTLVDDQIFFLINENGYLQVWKTDGTKAGTTFIAGNIQSSSVTGMSNGILTYLSLATFEGSLNGLFFFEVNSSTTGAKIWRSDGTMSGTFSVTAPLSGNGAGFDGISSGGTGYLTQHTFFKNHLYFVTRTGIMKTDGTAGNTVTLANLNNGSSVLIEQVDVAELNDKLYFSFFDFESNWHFIWETDGTPAGTRSVYNTSSSQYFAPSNLLPLDGKLLFTSKGDTEGSTSLISYNTQSRALTTITKLEESTNRPFYFHIDGRLDNKLYNLDGKLIAGITKSSSGFDKSSYFINIEDGTKEAGPDLRYTTKFHQFGNQYFFEAITQKQGIELWTTDGTPAHTRILKNINTGKSGLSHSTMNVLGNSIVFEANDKGSGLGLELWHHDISTKETSILADINKGTDSSSPYAFLKFKDKLYFSAHQTETGRELWVTDGTAAGTSLVSDVVEGAGSSSPYMLTNVGNHSLFFTSTINSREHLMKMDGTTIIKVKDMGVNDLGSRFRISSIIAAGDKAFFSVSGVGNALWVSDGTEAGTVKIKDLITMSFLTNGNDGYVYFIANNSGSYIDRTPGTLWKSDGTEAGTIPVFEHDQLPLSNIRNLKAFGDAIYFVAYSEDSGNEVWKTDGTLAGTAILKEIAPGKLSAISKPNFTVFNDKLYFVATDGERGTELWSTDGTAANTVMAHDIAEGVHSSFPRNLTPTEDKMYFSAATPTHGAELWVTDGSSFSMVAEMVPGENHSDPSNIMLIDNNLYFMANTNSEGRQLWSFANGVVSDVEDEILRKRLTVFPNPATDHLMFSYEEAGNRSIKNISVFDMVGRKHEVTTSPGGKKVHIGHLAPGIYLISFEIGNEHITKKFIKRSM